MIDSQFNLLSLPPAPLQRILFSFDYYSFINFSMCSKKINKFAKTVAPFMKLCSFHVYFERFKVTAVSELQGRTFMEITTLEDGTPPGCVRPDKDSYETRVYLPSWNNGHRSFVFCSDPVKGILKVANYIIDLFHIEPSVSLKKPYSFFTNDQLEAIIDWMPSSVRMFEVSDFENDLPILKILRRIKSAKQLYLMCSRFFKWFLDELKRIEFQSLGVHNAGGVKGFLELDLREISIGTSLTSEDVNFFLRKWKMGGYKKLCILSLRTTEEWDLDTIVNGLDAVQLGDDDIKLFRCCWHVTDYRLHCSFYFPEENYKKDPVYPIFYDCEIRGGWELRRQTDGSVARVYKSGEIMFMNIWHE